MIGAIIGDMVRSYWEFREEKDKYRNTPLFRPESQITDDSILTIATASSIMNNQFYSRAYQEYYRAFPNFGYGPTFTVWAQTSDSYLKENFSYGNGAGMRVSPVGWAFSSPQQVMMEAQQSASITHCQKALWAARQLLWLFFWLDMERQKSS